MAGHSTRQTWARGGTVFAATALIMLGLFQLIVAISAWANAQVLAGPGYVYGFNPVMWGWVHLGLGVLMVLTGIALYSAATWARVVGMVLALLSAVANFMFLPYNPIWAIVIIAVDVFVIWSLATVAGRGAAPPAAGAPETERRSGAEWSEVNAPPETQQPETKRRRKHRAS